MAANSPNLSLQNQLVVITGPTAVGKTKLAALLANEASGEIISADSRQVYQQMDIGTGKDLSDYVVQGGGIPYHLIDIVKPGERYNINAFYNDYQIALTKVLTKQKLPILCGGSGLYIETALEAKPFSAIPVNESLRVELDPLDKDELVSRAASLPVEVKEFVDISSKKRLVRAIEIGEYLKNKPIPIREQINVNPYVVILYMEREALRTRITERLKKRLEEGMIAEVENLLQSGITEENLVYYGLEYKWITNFLVGKISKDEMFDRLNTAIHRFAKRQMTWFRRMDKRMQDITWIDVTHKSSEEVLNMILNDLPR